MGYNRVFGYYLEVSKGNMSLVPDRYIRKQTLANGERYITEELKKIEDTTAWSQRNGRGAGVRRLWRNTREGGAGYAAGATIGQRHCRSR